MPRTRLDFEILQDGKAYACTRIVSEVRGALTQTVSVTA
jgi:hypothetical protein